MKPTTPDAVNYVFSLGSVSKDKISLPNCTFGSFNSGCNQPKIDLTTEKTLQSGYIVGTIYSTNFLSSGTDI